MNHLVGPVGVWLLGLALFVGRRRPAAYYALVLISLALAALSLGISIFGS
jgi:hypothetical protein